MEVEGLTCDFVIGLPKTKKKFEHQRLGGQLQPLDIPKWMWGNLCCDFVVRLHMTKKTNDDIWMAVGRLTKRAHFIPVRMAMSMQQLVKLYITNIVRLHGTPISIVHDRDARFTFRVRK